LCYTFDITDCGLRPGPLRARGEPSAARAFMAEIGGRFPRHRAFQDELKRAVQGMERALRREG